MDTRLIKAALMLAVVLLVTVLVPAASFANNEDPGGKAVYAKRNKPSQGFVTIGWDQNGDGIADTETVWDEGWFSG